MGRREPVELVEIDCEGRRYRLAVYLNTDVDSTPAYRALCNAALRAIHSPLRTTTAAGGLLTITAEEIAAGEITREAS